MLFTDHIFKNSECFPMTKKLSQVFVSKQAAKTFKHSAKQTVEIFKTSEKTKSWVQCLKGLAACLSYKTWLSYVFFQSDKVLFWSHFLFSHPFFVFMWVTAKYLQYGKLEKGWYNVIQKVKTLPVNKDKNVSGVLSISFEQLSKT